MTTALTRDQILEHQAAGTITERQAQILQYRRRGFSQYQLAIALGITRSTVRSLEKTANGKIEAATAIRPDLPPPSDVPRVVQEKGIGGGSSTTGPKQTTIRKDAA